MFFDQDAISVGESVPASIKQALDTCRIGLVLIGPQWLTLRSNDKKRRIDGEHDYVRLEVTALLSGDRQVMPILLNGASRPEDTELPPSIKKLAEHLGCPLRDGHDFNNDISRIIEAVKLALDRRTRLKPEPVIERPAPEQGGNRPAESFGSRFASLFHFQTVNRAACSFFSWLAGLFGVPSIDIAVCFREQHISLYVKGRGIVLNEPSVVAVAKAHT